MGETILDLIEIVPPSACVDWQTLNVYYFLFYFFISFSSTAYSRAASVSHIYYYYYFFSYFLYRVCLFVRRGGISIVSWRGLGRFAEGVSSRPETISPRSQEHVIIICISVVSERRRDMLIAAHAMTRRALGHAHHGVYIYHRGGIGEKWYIYASHRSVVSLYRCHSNSSALLLSFFHFLLFRVHSR